MEREEKMEREIDRVAGERERGRKNGLGMRRAWLGDD